jgi:hypothetical protein
MEEEMNYSVDKVSNGWIVKLYDRGAEGYINEFFVFETCESLSKWVYEKAKRDDFKKAENCSCEKTK